MRGFLEFCMLVSHGSHFFIICSEIWFSDGGFSVENPPVEVTPDFAHESCKGSVESVIGEIHWGKEDGFAPPTFSYNVAAR